MVRNSQSPDDSPWSHDPAEAVAIVQLRLDLAAARRRGAEANARAEHWAAQADRLARQVERMREAMEAVADEIEDLDGPPRLGLILNQAERLRAAAKGGDDAEQK